MAQSMQEYLQREMACEGLLECVYGLKALDCEIYQVLARSEESLTVDEIAAAVDRERSTAYRALQRLLSSGLIAQEQVNYDEGGYHYEYRPVDPDRVAEDMQRLLNDWYAHIDQLIGEFQDSYGEKVGSTTPGE